MKPLENNGTAARNEKNNLIHIRQMIGHFMKKSTELNCSHLSLTFQAILSTNITLRDMDTGSEVSGQWTRIQVKSHMDPQEAALFHCGWIIFFMPTQIHQLSEISAVNINIPAINISFSSNM